MIALRPLIPGLVKALRLGLLFAAPFLAVSVCLSLYLRSVSPPPFVIVLSPKLDIYTEKAEDYDTVFIGTSRTLYHIQPEAVEAGAVSAGCRRPSVFNFGVHGLSGAEQDWLITEVLDRGSASLEGVILEEPLPEPRTPGAATNDRQRFFHAPGLYDEKLSSITSYPESTPKRIFRTGIFAIGIIYDLSGVGRGAEALFSEPEEARPLDQNFLKEDGFEALDEIDFEPILARRQLFLDNPGTFESGLAKYEGGYSSNVPARADYMAAKLEALNAKGLKPAFYVSPDPQELDRTPLVGAAIAERSDSLVVNYNRPDVFPQLFNRDVWYDDSHFGRAGAELLSEQVGRDLCEAGFFEAEAE